MTHDIPIGAAHHLEFEVPETKTVPRLIPESEEFGAMPRVLATGFMVGLMEWACIRAVNPYIDWPRVQTVGIGINVSHEAATPPGLTVTVDVKLIKQDGRRLTFEVTASDGLDIIGRGVHDRYIIDYERFNARVFEK